MSNIFKRNIQITKLLSNRDYCSKISIFFSTKGTDDEYDDREQNYVYTNLNPQTILGYVRDFSPTSLVWKNYGLSETGAKEILCDDKYEDWFRNCNKIEIDDDEYEVFREASGNRVLITKLPYKVIKVVIKKV